MENYCLSLLVENNFGVLSRIAGLFARRGYNIDSLTVGTTEDAKVSRITITAVSYTHLSIIQAIKKQWPIGLGLLKHSTKIYRKFL